jgi:rfaE bifunctional protein kinase chain/domain
VAGVPRDEADLGARAHKLRTALKLRGLLVTRSEEGMTLFRAGGRSGGRVHVAAQAREVYDVSGAGDTVIATLGVAMAAGLAMDDAVRLANRAAGIVVGKFGTATVTPQELFS